uniref:Uncharacterized protein n=1 Tax=Fagus sylvatica TaxID=28930 RepID=A0A2N9F1M6_FAGSY
MLSQDHGDVCVVIVRHALYGLCRGFVWCGLMLCVKSSPMSSWILAVYG